MTCLSSLMRRAARAALLPLLAAPVVAPAAPPRPVKPALAAPAPVKADNGIIPLPLNPVLPPAQRVCATGTPGALQYSMLRPATGAHPGPGDVVLVNYIGYLAATGAVFDQGMQSALPVGGVIPGFSQGLQMLAKSGVARFCIPATLGYGAQASGPIPAYADLVFQVELLDYKSAAEVAAMNGTQATPPPAQPDAVPKP